MSLYTIIKSLQAAQGSLAKQAIMDANKDDELFKGYMQATYDPAISYYMTKTPQVSAASMDDVDIDFIDWIVGCIAGRVVTGKDAVAVLKMNLAAMTPEGQELVSYIIDRKIGASVGDTMVLKTWPNLYFIPPYQRCSLLDAKAKLKVAKLKRFIVQTKCDGMFAYLVKRKDGSCDVFSRQGQTYPKSFSEKLTKYLPNGVVLVGELEVHTDSACNPGMDTLLDRKTGNGLLNSARTTGEMEQGFRVACRVWDALTEAEFTQKFSIRKYENRLEELKTTVELAGDSSIEVVPTWIVSTLAEANSIYSDHTSRGLEGCIASDPASLWKDGTATDKWKMKLKFEAEYRCKGVIEGEGKAKGMVGAIEIETEDGLLECNCGTGFSDKQRKEFFDNPSLIVGHVVMLSANDIIQSRDARKKPALSLPVFEEIRHDKTVANTLPEVLAILAAAKG